MTPYQRKLIRTLFKKLGIKPKLPKDLTPEWASLMIKRLTEELKLKPQ